MFTVHCPRHGGEVLLGHRQIRSITGEGDDLVVRWQCWCGHRGRRTRRQRITSPR